MKCLIVAAGQGARLREKVELKPLIPVRGVPLIERVIAGARRGGIDGFVVVSGHRGDELRAHLDRVVERDGLDLVHVENRDWARANGVSVLAAEGVLDGPFVLSMCDHLVDPAIVRRLLGTEARPDRVVLAVDFNIDDPINDPDDATRVKVTGDGRIASIGKLIEDYDCHDTGVFLCGPAMFEALRRSQAAGDDSISGAMNVLAREGRAAVLDIGDLAWIDVDDAAALAKAEALLDAGRL